MPPTPLRRKKRASKKAIAANRRNAQLSTGPKSIAGRQTVSRNAVKHGLAGNTAFHPDEDRAAYEHFCREITAEYKPATPDESKLTQSVADNLWRLDRIPKIENSIFAGARAAVSAADIDKNPDNMQIAMASARTFQTQVPRLLLLSLYEQRISRALHKSRANLRQLQDTK